MGGYECHFCQKVFNSAGSMYNHRREKHVHYNCQVEKCNFCEKDFYSPISQKKGIPNVYRKCEECRDIEKSVSSNSIVPGMLIYHEEKRYRANKGTLTSICRIYTCEKETESGFCNDHDNKEFKTCQGSQCSKVFLVTGYNFCEKCRDKGDKSKNNTRQKLQELKVKLGGKCKDCGTTDLFKLEFDHIDPKKKTKQITRMAPKDWEKELINIQLLCSTCHRIKSSKERNEKFTDSPCNKNKDIIMDIKRKIGGCQMCNWKHDDDNFHSSGLDFDHVSGEKFKQISALYKHEVKTMVKEIKLCRLLCRACHQMHTCLQRGGKMLKYYYTDNQIEELKKKFFDEEKNKEYQEIVHKICNDFLDSIVVPEIIPVQQKEPQPPKRRIVQYLKDGNEETIIAIYENMSVAGRKLGTPNSGISRAVNGIAENCIGYKWRYEKENCTETVTPNTEKLQPKKIVQRDLYGKFIASYDSNKLAALAVDRDNSNISKAITLGRKCAGYRWSLE